MKFNCGPTKRERELAKKIAMQERAIILRAWHDHFALLPVRIGHACYWLETVQRRFPNAYYMDYYCIASIQGARKQDAEYRVKEKNE